MTENEEQPSGKEKENKKVLVDELWSVFRSTRVAIILLILISATAIMGTLIPQNPSPDQIAGYSEGMRRLFETLNLFDLYHSRWFHALLALLCINLLICSLERLPQVMNQIRLERVAPASGDPERMRLSVGFDVSGTPDDIAEKVRAFLKKAGGRVAEETTGDNRFFLLNRGRYSRFGVYVFHFSIILIVLGALVGNIMGYRGKLVVTEGGATDSFFREGGKGEDEMRLGFTVGCKSFSFFLDPQTDMAQDYTSKLYIQDGEQKVAEPTVMVNHPFKYKGIGLYQASYELRGVQSVTVAVRKKGGAELGRVEVPSGGNPVEIAGGGKLTLLDAVPDPQTQTVIGATIQLDGGDAGKATLELRQGAPAALAGTTRIEIIVRSLADNSEIGRVLAERGEEVPGPGGSKLKVLEYSPNFEVHGKTDSMVQLAVTEGGQTVTHRLFGSFPNFDKMNAPKDRYYQIGEVTEKPPENFSGPYDYSLVGSDGLYATILDVNYDPGVWLVWLGCAGLFVGMGMAFFWSHRKLWVKVSAGRVSVGGQANRNAQAFEMQFRKFAEKFKEFIAQDKNETLRPNA